MLLNSYWHHMRRVVLHSYKGNVHLDAQSWIIMWVIMICSKWVSGVNNDVLIWISTLFIFSSFTPDAISMEDDTKHFVLEVKEKHINYSSLTLSKTMVANDWYTNGKANNYCRFICSTILIQFMHKRCITSYDMEK